MPDHRHARRIKLMQQLFARTFSKENQASQTKAPTDVEQTVLDEILEQLPQIDELIAQAAPERPVSQMSKLDLAILRLIVFESRMKKTPIKVLINEAVELAKEFGSDSSPRLVNGVLGTILLDSKLEEEKKVE